MITANVDGPATRILGLDPDGSGSLAANQFTVSGQITLGGTGVSTTIYVCRLAISTGDTLGGVAGTAPYCNTTSFTSNSFGYFTSPVLTYNDVGSNGGAVALRVCAETDGNPGFSAGDACASTPVWVYFATAGALSVNPTSLTNGTQFASTGTCASGDYRPDCPGATTTKDATVQHSFTMVTPSGAPAPPAVKLVYEIQDADPPYGSAPFTGDASASWTSCAVPATSSAAPQEGTDVQGSSQTVSGSGTTVVTKDLWLCGPGNNNTGITLRVYWDVNGDGLLTAGLDQPIGTPATLTVN